MESSMSMLNFDKKYFVLTSFREPLSHFISSYEHQWRHHGPARISLEKTADQLLRKQNVTDYAHYYDLRNFQSQFLIKNPPPGQWYKSDVVDEIDYIN